MLLYLDGVEVGRQAATGMIAAAAEVKTWIGGNPPDDTGRPWKGSVADVLIYERALSASEIQAVANPLADTEPSPSACQNVSCSGHGACVEILGEAMCRCETGYVAEGLSCAAADLDLGDLVYGNDFESGDIDGLRCSGNCPTVSQLRVASGSYAGSFELDRTMATPYRTEAVIDGGLNFDFNQDYSIFMSYRFEDWQIDSDAESAPLQIHTRSSSWDAACALGSAYSTAPFFIANSNGRSHLVTYGGQPLWEGPLTEKQWYSIRIDFRISSGADGYVEAWLDGNLLGRKEGPNSPATDKCGLPMRTPYFKMGVYKWNWKVERPVTESTRRHLLIDELEVYRR